jgi:hypothetical protein
MKPPQTMASTSRQSPPIDATTHAIGRRGVPDDGVSADPRVR